METWTTVWVALIVALSTLGATYLQNRQSNKRFEKELEQTREENRRKRRWEVRSVPLLKLRGQLGVMVTKDANVLRYATLERITLLAEKAGQTMRGARGEAS